MRRIPVTVRRVKRSARTVKVQARGGCSVPVCRNRDVNRRGSDVEAMQFGRRLMAEHRARPQYSTAAQSPAARPGELEVVRYTPR